MQDRTQSQILRALLSVLKTLAQSLLKNGIGYREFNEIAKSAFVDVATSDYGLRGRPTNISRVAVMTGLTRKEVRRIRDKIESGDTAVVARSTPLAAVLHTWFSNVEYIGDDGKPLPLRFDGPSPNFTDLVKKAGGDIPPGAMRTELRRIDAIEEVSDGRLVAKKRYATSRGADQTLITGLTRGLYPLGLTISHNVDASNSEESWIQRTVSSNSVRADDVVRLRRITFDRLSEFTEAMDDLYSAYETLHSSSSGESEKGNVGIGVFYFEE